MDRRKQKIALLIAYKYFYRSVTVDEFNSEARKEGLLQMSDKELEQYRLKLVEEHRAIEAFFGASISDLLKKRSEGGEESGGSDAIWG